MDAMEPAEGVSYIIIHDLSPEARMLYLSPSLTDVLGYEPSNIIGTSSFDWIHPDEVEAARQLHYDTIREDKFAAIAYLRVRHLDDNWVHCVIQRSMVHNALIGSISFAKPGARALHTAATAAEVTFLTPSMSQNQFEFRRWNHPPNPSPPHPRPPLDLHSPETFLALPPPSRRTGIILNRFSRQCTVLFCTNDCILPAVRLRGRPFYDFVAPEDEQQVRGWIDVSKGWAVSESGLPSDGGFVFGSFRMYIRGRDSVQGEQRVRPRAAGSRQRQRGRGQRQQRQQQQQQQEPEEGASAQMETDDEDMLPVDAIFSAHSDGFIVVLRKAEPLQHG